MTSWAYLVKCKQIKTKINSLSTFRNYGHAVGPLIARHTVCDIVKITSRAVRQITISPLTLYPLNCTSLSSTRRKFFLLVNGDIKLFHVNRLISISYTEHILNSQNIHHIFDYPVYSELRHFFFVVY